MRARRIRLIVILVTVGVVVAGFVDGFAQEPSPEGTVQAFLLAWQQHNTTPPPPTPPAARRGVRALADAYSSWTRRPCSCRWAGSASTAARPGAFTASVNLGEGGHQWTYSGQFALRKLGSGWKIEWSPSVIDPQLGAGERLAVITQVPARASVLDTAGQPLEVPSAVLTIGVWPRALPSPPRRRTTSPR